VTDVDIVYLSKQLVGARFPVKETNRLCRNLEAFRPQTLSKWKPDTEDFFKVVMALPAPKPRNIVKDIKVIYWKGLSLALEEIIRNCVNALENE
jgi:hypothetical protein